MPNLPHRPEGYRSGWRVGVDPDLTPANPAVAPFAAQRTREATPDQRRRTATTYAAVARHERRFRAIRVGHRLVAVPRRPSRPRPPMGCCRTVRPRRLSRRSPRISRAGPTDDDGSDHEPAPARPELVGGAR
jgi:hypothetical protein